MRLICGLLRLDGAPADDASVAKMAAAMTPPGQMLDIATYTDGPVAMAVLGFAPDTATLATAADGSVLAADMRLDRPGEVASRLGLPASATAEALALAGLERWGGDLADRLDGDYALAAWNPRTRTLNLARDIFAVRPLCSALLPGRLFAFASLPKGLYGSGLVPPQADLPALARRIFKIYDQSEATGYRDITWLAAGHVLTIGGDGAMRMVRGWRPEPSSVGTWRGSPQDAAAILRDLICEAVKARIPEHGTVAAHLSGGLDSSAVSVLAARRLRETGRRLTTYAFLAAPGVSPRSDVDRRMIESVLAQENNIDLHITSLAGTDPLAIIDTDLPGVDFELANHANTYAAAAAAGANLFLTGAGGDEGATLNSGQLHRELLRVGLWRTLLTDLRARARHERLSLWHVVYPRLVRPFLPDWICALEERLRRLDTPDRRQALGLLAPQWRAAFADFVPARLPQPSKRPEGRIAMLTRGFLASRNTIWAVMGARYGLTTAHPLLDRRIVDFALSLPLERQVRDGHSRQPFRDAMAGILPDSLRLARGKGDGLPLVVDMLCAAKPGLLAASARYRDAAAALLDMNAVAGVLTALPESPDLVDRPHRAQAVAALRALSLARHLAQMG